MRRLIISAFALFAVLGSINQSAATTYNVNRTIGTGSVIGSFDTDGTLGVLSDSNITSWQLTLTSPNLSGGSPDVISGIGTGVIVDGSALFATATDVTFDFLAGNGSGFALRGSSGNAWCMATEGINCLLDGTAPSEVILFGSATTWAELRNPGSAEVIASVTAVPEPEIYAMMGIGLGLMGWIGRRKKQEVA